MGVDPTSSVVFTLGPAGVPLQVLWRLADAQIVVQSSHDSAVARGYVRNTPSAHDKDFCLSEYNSVAAHTKHQLGAVSKRELESLP